jgi:putative inorganic carbon (HCO3(-)) transporter
LSASRSIQLTLGSAGVLVAGGIGATLVAMVPLLDLKSLLEILAAVGTLLLALLSRRAKDVYFAAYILALTYNRQYFSFNGLFGDMGPHGIYWVPADPLLLLLFAVSSLEVITGREQAARSTGLMAGGAAPVLPFLAVCLVSMLTARHPEWAVSDAIRVVKLALLMIWLHRNLTPRLWLTAVAALGAAIVMQSGLGVLQVLVHSGKNLLSVVGVGASAPDLGEEIENRARGTLGHPNFLAPYLLVLVPAAVGLALFSRNLQLKLLGGAISLAGLAGIAASQSRAPTALIAVAVVAMLLIATRLRALSPATLLGGSVIGVTMIAALLLPYRDAIAKRIYGDLTASVEFREEYNAAALSMWNEHPLLGVGLNNFTVDLQRYSKRLAGMVRQLEQLQDQAAIRAAAPVHNVYLLILAETGVLGLMAFLIFLAAVLRRGIRASVATTGATRGICIGLTVGLLANFAQQTVDFSLWFDPSWYTLGLVAALLGAAPGVAPRLP